MHERYCRQLKSIGEEGQRKLANSAVFVIGAGGIGSPLLLYLAGAGIGRLGFIDDDTVDYSNLHRQILFREPDQGKTKASVALQSLKALNSTIRIEAFSERLNLNNAYRLFQTYDLIIDGSDNFQTRYLVNDFCCQLEKPLLSASIYRDDIHMLAIQPDQGCYRCLFPEPPPPTLMGNCSLAGVIGAMTGMAGSMACAMALSRLQQDSSPQQSFLSVFNGKTFQYHRQRIVQQPQCVACQQKQISWPSISYSIDAKDIQWKNYVVVDVREHHEDRSILVPNTQKHTPFSTLLQSVPDYPRQPLLLYCQSGHRSEYAVHLLRKKGITAHSLNGGVCTMSKTSACG